MSDVSPLMTYSAMVDAGLTDLPTALTMALVAIGQMPDNEDVLEHASGPLDRELRDLAHHLIHNIPDPGVASWVEGGTPQEKAGLKKLVASARQFGYRDDDLTPAP